MVHATAFLTFVGWMIASGDAHRAITIAIAVLIITCPCALGLAVPMVQVVAARRLFERGIMIKDGGALERLADVDTVVFDKTGTLTSPANRRLMAGSRRRSQCAGSRDRRPFAPSLFPGAGSAWHGNGPIAFDAVSEHARRWVSRPASGQDVYRAGPSGLGGGRLAARCRGRGIVGQRTASARHLPSRRQLAPDAREALDELKRAGLQVEILSGDAEQRVGAIALRLGVPATSGATPADKVCAHRASLRQAGHRVLMVGDGLNDAPALAAADVSMAPATAADIGRNAADLVFLRESLVAVPQAIAIARSAARLVRQNFVLAIAYNVIAIPIAVLGHVTPLIGGGRDVGVVGHRGRQRAASRRRTASAGAGRRTDRPRRRSGAMIDFFFLVPIAIGMGLAGLASFMWTLRSGQYDDLEGAAQRILFESHEGPIVGGDPAAVESVRVSQKKAPMRTAGEH